MLGMGLGLFGRRAASVPPRVTVDFTNATIYPAGGMSPAAFAALNALTFSNATSGTPLTIESSASTVISGLGGVARFGTRSDAAHRGLRLEQQATNLEPNSGTFFASTSNGATITASQADPSGGTAATRIQTTTTTFSGYNLFDPVITPTAYSVWHMRGSVGATWQSFCAGAAKGGTAPSAWARDTFSETGSGAGQYTIPVDGRDHSVYGGVVAGARDDILWQVQQEAGLAPTSLIITGASAVTRSADLLSDSVPTRWIQNGQLNFEVSFAPLWDRILYSTATDFILWYVDANNKCVLQKSTGVIAVTILGTQVSLTAIDWVQGDVIDLYVSAGGSQATQAWFRRNSGIAQSAGSGPSLGNIPTTSPIRFFNDGTNCTGNVDIQFLTAW